MSVRKRLERLEDHTRPEPAAGNPRRARLRERFFHAFENGRRELNGLESLPDLPYTEEDREDDRRFLEETIPEYRAGPGWQSTEAKDVLDAWQQMIEERLAKGA